MTIIHIHNHIHTHSQMYLMTFIQFITDLINIYLLNICYRHGIRFWEFSWVTSRGPQQSYYSNGFSYCFVESTTK